MKKINFVFILFFSFAQWVVAQDYDYAKPNQVVGNKPSFSLDAGTTFMASKRMTGMNQYVRPSLQYKTSDRFTLSAGTMFSFGNYHSRMSEYGMSGKIATTSFYTAGSYLLNDKVTVYGSVMYSKFAPMDSKSKQGTIMRDAKTMSFGVDYKITKNIHFGVEVRHSDAPYRFDYQASPFGY